MSHPRGFIALITVLLVGATLLAFSAIASQDSFALRAEALDREERTEALALANACADIALMEASEQHDLLLAPAGETHVVEGQDCQVNAISYGQENAQDHARMAEIFTSAKVGRSSGSIELDALLQNPEFSKFGSSPAVLGRFEQ